MEYMKELEEKSFKIYCVKKEDGSEVIIDDDCISLSDAKEAFNKMIDSVTDGEIRHGLGNSDNVDTFAQKWRQCAEWYKQHLKNKLK